MALGMHQVILDSADPAEEVSPQEIEAAAEAAAQEAAARRKRLLCDAVRGCRTGRLTQEAMVSIFREFYPSPIDMGGGEMGYQSILVTKGPAPHHLNWAVGNRWGWRNVHDFVTNHPSTLTIYLDIVE